MALIGYLRIMLSNVSTLITIMAMPLSISEAEPLGM